MSYAASWQEQMIYSAGNLNWDVQIICSWEDWDCTWKVSGLMWSSWPPFIHCSRISSGMIGTGELYIRDSKAGGDVHQSQPCALARMCVAAES